MFELPLESLIHCNFLKNLKHKFGKRLNNISKQFEVLYQGCGACYYDGTLPVIPKNRRYLKPTTYLFWKETEDVTNRVSTR